MLGMIPLGSLFNPNNESVKDLVLLRPLTIPRVNGVKRVIVNKMKIH